MSPHTTIAHTKTPSLVLTVAFLLLINCVHPELQLKEGIEEKGGGGGQVIEYGGCFECASGVWWRGG